MPILINNDGSFDVDKRAIPLDVFVIRNNFISGYMVDMPEGLVPIIGKSTKAIDDYCNKFGYKPNYREWRCY